MGPESAGRLAELPPGPELGSALAQVPSLSLSGSTELAVVVSARARQVAFDQAELLASAHELALCRWDAPDQPARLEGLDEFSADQVGFTLTWTRQHAPGQALLARDLLRRLPRVFEALREGRLDLAKARLFSEKLAPLPDEVAAGIADLLLAKAATWTYTQLQDALRYHVKKTDPALARRRYAEGVAGRRIWLGAGDDGTAGTTALDHRLDCALWT